MQTLTSPTESIETTTAHPAPQTEDTCTASSQSYTEETQKGRLSMPRLLNFAFVVRAAIVLLILACAFSHPAQALTFKEAAKTGATIKVNELDPMKGFLAKAASKVLKKLPLKNVQAEDAGLTGDVRMRGLDWRVIIHAGDDTSTSFVAFQPKLKFTFKDLIGNNPASQLFDLMTFDHQMLFITAGEVSLDSDEMPSVVKTALAPLYDGAKDFSLSLDEGFSLIGSLNLGKSGILDKSMKFLGAKSSVLQLKGALDVTIIDSMMEAISAPKTPTIKLAAAVPAFRPSLGGLVTLPADIEFSYVAELEKGGKPVVGMEGETKFRIGGKDMNIVLANTINLGKGAPDFKISATLFKGLPYERAFGLSWLTIENYRMDFKLNASGTLVTQFEGDTTFGSKTLTLGGGLSIGTKTGGLPIPQSLLFSVDDGEDKVATLALVDMLSVYNTMAKATGNPLTVPLNDVPDVAIAGIGKGPEKGPKVKLIFEQGGDDGFDIQGKFRLLGADIATVERAFLKVDSGIEIKANVTELKAGPITLPHGSAEIVLLLDKEEGKIPTPKVSIHTKSLDLFGVNQSLDLEIRPTYASYAAAQAFGELFKFKFGADASVEAIKSFSDLGKADFALNASLASDPAKWIRTAGKAEVKKYFKHLTKGEQAALDALDVAKKKVDSLDRQINQMKAKVKAERKPAIDALKSAEAEVRRLQGEIDHFERRRSHFRGQIRSCNQTYRGCVLWSVRRTGCHKRVFGHCVIPRLGHYCARRASIPDYAQRGICEAANTKPRAEMLWADGKKHAVIAAKIVAEETVAGIRKSINKLPVELDPRVSGLIAAKETAKLGLEGAKQAVKGLAQLAVLLEKGVNALDAPDIFALKESSIQGNLAQALKGAPVIIDLNYTIRGKLHHNRFAFGMGNAADNARRFGVLALGIAVKEVIKAGKSLKVIPHVALDQVENLFMREMAKLDAELKKVTANNTTPTVKIPLVDPAKARLTMANVIATDHVQRRKQAETEQKRAIALQKQDGDKLSKARIAQLNVLLRGNKWKQMPGKALDISAGANGSVWGIGMQNGIWSWTGSNWKKMPGKGKRIDVGPKGHAWVIGMDDSVYRWDGKKWVPMGNTKFFKAHDIGVGADGSVWAIRAKGGKPSGYMRWTGAQKGWALVNAFKFTTPSWPKSSDGRMYKRLGHSAKLGMKRIDVDDQGRPWIVMGNNYLARYNKKSKMWNGVAGTGLDIGVGGDGTVVTVSYDRFDKSRDFAPFVWNGKLGGKAWNIMAGGMKQITVDANGDPWGIDAANNIWAWGSAAKAKAAHITVPRPRTGGGLPQTGGGSPVPQNAAFQTFKSGGDVVLKVRTTGMCIDQADGAKPKGAGAVSWGCNSNKFQTFKVEWHGDAFVLKSRNSNMCLGVAGASKNNGARVVHWPCVYKGDHLWRFEDRGGNWFALKNAHSGKCLDLLGGRKPNGSPFGQWTCDDKSVHKKNQTFQLVTARATGGGSPVPGPAWESFKMRHSNRCLDVAGGSAANGSTALQWDCHKGANQQWRRVYKGGGWFELRAKHSNKCLDVAQASKANGANVHQWDCHGGHNQQWRQVDRGNGWVALQARHSNRCLDVAGGASGNGGNFLQWDCHKGHNQQLRGIK